MDAKSISDFRLPRVARLLLLDIESQYRCDMFALLVTVAAMLGVLHSDHRLETDEGIVSIYSLEIRMYHDTAK